MAFCNNTNIVGSIPTIELTGCKHGAPAVFASGGENALCDPLGQPREIQKLQRPIPTGFPQVDVRLVLIELPAGTAPSLFLLVFHQGGQYTMPNSGYGPL